MHHQQELKSNEGRRVKVVGGTWSSITITRNLISSLNLHGLPSIFNLFLKKFIHNFDIEKLFNFHPTSSQTRASKS
jgi:hypothetical protein